MKKVIKKFTAALLSLAVICTGANGISSYTKAAKKPSLKLSKSSTLTKGQTKKLKITTSGIKKIVSVKWKSSKKSVVKITKSSGKTATIKARKNGKAVISASIKYKVKSSSKTTSKKLKCTVTVEATPDTATSNTTTSNTTTSNTTTLVDIIPTTFGENMIEATINGTRTLFFYGGGGLMSDDGSSYWLISFYSFTAEGKPQYNLWMDVPNKTGTHQGDRINNYFHIYTAYDSANNKWYNYFSDGRGPYGSITVDSVVGQTLTGTFETTLRGVDLSASNNYTAGMPDVVITNGRFHFSYGQKHDVIKKWEESKTNTRDGSGEGNSNVANPGDVGNSDVGSSNDRRTCGTCRGTGKITCTYCSGKGYTEKTYMPPFGGKVETIQTRCTHCSQTGRENCYVCNGKGWW